MSGTSHTSSASEVCSFAVTACRGVSGAGCRFAMDVDDDILSKIDTVMEASGWDAFLRSVTRGPLNHHNAFKISVAACPNGCSRPHIADVGFLRACVPAVELDKCTQCRICEKVCPDKAVLVSPEGPQFDMAKCQKCGLCVAKCKDDALHCSESGYRIVLGGKLGRHPRLASELEGIFTADQCADVLGKAVTFYMEHHAPRVRFGTLVEERYADLLEQLGV